MQARTATYKGDVKGRVTLTTVDATKMTWLTSSLPQHGHLLLVTLQPGLWLFLLWHYNYTKHFSNNYETAYIVDTAHTSCFTSAQKVIKSHQQTLADSLPTVMYVVVITHYRGLQASN